MVRRVRSMEVTLRQRPVTHSKLSAVLTIAGSDSSGGAGIEADLKTFSAHHCYGVTCITALTAQNSTGVRAVVETPQVHIQQTLDAVLEEFSSGQLQLKVVKTGMLTKAAVSVVAHNIDLFRQLGLRIVVDPVMVSTSGVTLADDPTMGLCMESVIPNAYLCTPNMDEAVKMAGAKEITDVADFRAFAVALHRQLGCENLLLKGGHLPFQLNGELKEQSKEPQDQIVVDVLVTASKVTVFKSRFIECQNTHGTGCTLSSAIAANLSQGRDLETAVALSIDYIHGAMTSDLQRLDHTVEAETTRANVERIASKTSTPTVWSTSSFLSVLQGSSPWKEYTQHRILDLIATDALPKAQFLYFLKQDYYYLENYARIQGHAIAVARTCQQIETHTEALRNILEELRRHRAKFSGSSLGSPGRACVQYCDYLSHIGRTEDLLGITVAVAPCLHGYAEAGVYGQKKRSDYLKTAGVEGDPMYSAWLADYTSEWYTTAHTQGMQALQQMAEEEQPDAARRARLAEIFSTVTALEIAFWDEVLQQVT